MESTSQFGQENSAVPNRSRKGASNAGDCFRMLNDVSIETLPDPEWLIEGVIPANNFVEIHGMPATKKSFLALSVALSVASGKDWFGRGARQGNVVYIAAEGATGYKARVASWKDANDFVGLAGVHIITEPVQLAVSDHIDNLIAQVRRHELAPVLFIFDTLSRCLEGANENSAESMSRAIGGASRLCREFYATVMVVHHTGKDGGAERGSSALRAALDTMYSVKAEGDSITLHCEKMKDAEAAKPMRFVLEPVGSSCVLRLSGDTKDAMDAPTDSYLSEAKRAVLQVLTVGAMRFRDWQVQSGAAESTFKKYRVKFEAQGLVRKNENEWYELTDAGRRAVGVHGDVEGLQGHEPYPSSPRSPVTLGDECAESSVSVDDAAVCRLGTAREK